MVTAVIDALACTRDEFPFPYHATLRFLDYSIRTIAVRGHIYRQLWDRRSTTGTFRPQTVPGGHFYLSSSPALATRCLTDLIRSRHATEHQ